MILREKLEKLKRIDLGRNAWTRNRWGRRERTGWAKYSRRDIEFAGTSPMGTATIRLT